MAHTLLIKKDPKKGQFWMRGRIVAQGLTFAAMLGGALLMGIGDEHRVKKRGSPAAAQAPIDQENTSSDLAKEL